MRRELTLACWTFLLCLAIIIGFRPPFNETLRAEDLLAKAAHNYFLDDI